MPNGIPVIGEVVLSTHDKYSENGVDKYDQLLCDGNYIPNDHEILKNKSYINLGIELTSKYTTVNSGNYLRSVFYRGGEDGYMVSTIDGDYILYLDNNFNQISSVQFSPRAQGVCEWGGYNFRLESDTSSSSGRVLIKYDQSWSELDRLIITNSSNLLDIGIKDDLFYIADGSGQMIHIINPDTMVKISDTPVTKDGVSVNPSSLYWVDSDSMWYISLVGLGIYTCDEIFSVGDPVSEINNSGVYIGDISGMSGSNIGIVITDGRAIYQGEVGKVTPKITSVDPSTPYRIVADLTEDE